MPRTWDEGYTFGLDGSLLSDATLRVRGDRMNVLVTGGAGFLGRHLVSALLYEGDHVIVLDNGHRGSREALIDVPNRHRLRFIDGDIRERDQVAVAMHGAEVVYHLAAQSNVIGAVSNIEYSFTTNVVGTYNVLCVARDLGVQRVVFSSSREVYGEVETFPVAEDHPLDPKNAYGVSKVAAELYCRAFQRSYGLDVSVLRLSNVYGPGDRDRVIPIWLQSARDGVDLALYGGTQVLDLVPVDLVVTALRRAAALSLSGQPVNVGSGVGTPLRQLAEEVLHLPGVNVGIRLCPGRDVEVTRYVADVTLMRELLDIVPPLDPLAEVPVLWETEKAGAA